VSDTVSSTTEGARDVDFKSSRACASFFQREPRRAKRRPKIDTSFKKLRTAISHNKSASALFYRVYRDYHAPPSPCTKHSNVRRRLNMILTYFTRMPKIDTSPKTLQMFVGPCGGPYEVFVVPCTCPCGCSNSSSLRSSQGSRFARLHVRDTVSSTTKGARDVCFDTSRA